MNWTLVVTLAGLALLITLLMRPDIFIKALRGGGEKAERKVYRPKSEAEFRAELNKPQPTETKRDDDHG
jgi:hypothetical protein